MRLLIDQRARKGFTLIELLVAMGILAAISSFAVPGIADWIAHFKLRRAASNMFAFMQFVKFTAVKENARVVVSFDTESNRCSAFVDDGSGDGIADNWTREGKEKTVLRLLFDPSVVLYEAIFSGGKAHFRFNGRGFPNGAGGHVYLKNGKGGYLGIVINMTGRSRIISSKDGLSWH